jgi:predicted PurR-regulated permease PerM
MVTIGVFSAIGYFLMDLPFWLPLGIWAGLTEVIPFIGPYLAGGAAVTVALTVSLEKALLVVIFVVVLQQIEGAVLVPRVMKNAVGMSPLTVILAVLVGGAVGGPIGAILAIPVGAACQVLLHDLLKQRQEGLDGLEATPPVPSAKPGSDEPTAPSQIEPAPPVTTA